MRADGLVQPFVAADSLRSPRNAISVGPGANAVSSSGKEMSANVDDRLSRANERPDVPVLPALIFGVGLLAGSTAQLISPLTIVPAHFADPLSRLGQLVIAVASVPVLWAVVSMLRLGTPPNPRRPTTALITSGPFRFTRNPIYVGLIAVSAGIALTANALFLLLSIPFMVLGIYRGAIVHEERYLEARFGADYRAFKTRVRRWI